MSQRLSLGQTGNDLVFKFNENASELEILHQDHSVVKNNVQNLQANVGALISKKHVATEIFSQDKFDGYVDLNEKYNYKCTIDRDPISWYFRERDISNQTEHRVYFDSAYRLMPDGSGLAIIFAFDDNSPLLENNKHYIIELVVNYYE